MREKQEGGEEEGKRKSDEKWQRKRGEWAPIGGREKKWVKVGKVWRMNVCMYVCVCECV